MHVEDLDISPSKVAETAQRIIDRAIEESRRREHALLTNEHLFLAFAQVEWDMFAEVMHDVDLNPHTILQAIEEHLHMMPSFAGRDLRVSPATKLVFKLALHHASRAGRQTIEAADLFSAVFEETQGVPVSILRIEVPEGHEAIRVGEWKWPEDNRVEAGKEGGVGRDPDREADHGDDGERGTLTQRTRGVAHVLKEGVHLGVPVG